MRQEQQHTGQQIKKKPQNITEIIKKEYINRPENRDKYKELNKKYVEKYRNQLKQVMTALTVITANKNAEKLKNNAIEAKKTIEEGRPIMQRLMKK